MGGDFLCKKNLRISYSKGNVERYFNVYRDNTNYNFVTFYKTLENQEKDVDHIYKSLQVLISNGRKNVNKGNDNNRSNKSFLHCFVVAIIVVQLAFLGLSNYYRTMIFAKNM